MPQPDFMTPSEFAVRMRLSTKTVLRRIADGTIPALKLCGQWRIPRAALDRALDRADDQRAEREAAHNTNTNTEHEEP